MLGTTLLNHRRDRSRVSRNIAALLLARRLHKHRACTPTPLTQWRKFEAEMKNLGYAWTIHYATENLAPADPMCDPMRIDHLLPDDFLAFTKAVGYPMVGYSYYCRVGFSILPPAWQATTSTFVDGEESAPHDPFGVMFAGQELSDLDGWAFRRGDAGIEVHDVEGASLTTKVAGGFTEWLTERLALLLEYGRNPTNEAEIAEGQEQGEPDPHRLVDYSSVDEAEDA